MVTWLPRPSVPQGSQGKKDNWAGALLSGGMRASWPKGTQGAEVLAGLKEHRFCEDQLYVLGKGTLALSTPRAHLHSGHSSQTYPGPLPGKAPTVVVHSKGSKVLQGPWQWS